MKKIKHSIITSLIFLFLFIPKIYATSATMSFSSDSSVEINKTINVTLRISNISDGNVTGIVGDIHYDDQYLQCSPGSGIANATKKAGASAYKVVYQAPMGSSISGGTNVYTISCKALKTGSTVIEYKNDSVVNEDSDDVGISSSKKTISIIEPVIQENTQQNQDSPSTNTNTNNNNSSSSNTNNSSSNNNSSSSSTSNNNKSTTTDNKKDTKTDTTKKKDGSSDNKLSALSIEGLNISPEFNTNTTKYSVEVAHDVDSVKVNAKANDSKAKVTIKGDSGLKIGKNTLSIIVEAENGDKKTYTIEVNKAQDPNKTYNSNNYLSDIKPSIGILSPNFDKEKENYVLYLPYEVDKITFETPVEDNSATVEVEGTDNLSIGDNIFEFKVRAENGDIRTYKVIVKRANIFDLNKNNIYLKNIKLENGTLLIDFDKNVKVYEYKKDKDFKFEAEAEDENSIVTTLQDGDDIYFIVTAPNGDYSVYALHLSKGININLILMFILGLVLGVLFILIIKYFKTKKRKLNIE